ncbi:MAG TPA: rhodanese-like domain-containing protein [Phycisphaerae bacterium]|nr:rhodanese-like domain-containing protein [Phycisphaerae bacterium]
MNTPNKIPSLTIDPQWEVSPQKARELLQSGQPFLLLDVRRPNEWQTARIDGAKLIPMDQLTGRLDELSQWREAPVVVHCHHGIRSRKATEWLRQAGFKNVYSMAGGIEAWSMLIDPTVPRY